MSQSTKKIEFISNSPGQTVKAGEKIASALKGDQVIALTGPLGAGKTHLVKGIARDSYRDNSTVSSPTFVIINEYTCPGQPFDIYHIDAYRIESAMEFEMLGFEDMLDIDSVVIIEWADKVMPCLCGIDYSTVEMRHLDRDRRKITITGPLAQSLKSQDFSSGRFS